MKIADFHFELPEDRIARHPAPRREAARLMLLERNTGRTAQRHVFDLPDILRPGDLLVFNDSRVLPARLFARRDPGGGRVEILLLERIEDDRWNCLAKPARRLQPGVRLDFDEGLQAECVETREGGERLLQFRYEGDWQALLQRVGHTPLPPYILRARRQARPQTDPTTLDAPEDRERYQTVYAGNESESVAAPTAGLHFSPELLGTLEERGIERAFVRLHVGAGTFLPVQGEHIEDHPMHSERFSIGPEAAAQIQDARREGRRVIAVGTTVVRALESAALYFSGEPCPPELFRQAPGQPPPGGGDWQALAGSTRLLIAPGFRFRAVDAMLTNFHLPDSTLIVLVAAFAGQRHTLDAYRRAVAEGYRFYSYGDAMLILDAF